MEKRLNIFFIVGGSIILISFISYIANFGFHISSEHEKWAHFGDFMNLFVAIANLVVFSSITYYLSKVEERRALENEISENTKVRPVLIFIDIGQKWMCKNVGERAAMNIMISYSLSSQEDWEKPVKIYSLMSNEDFVIEWKKTNIGKWAASYYDIHGSVYSSICTNDDTNFRINQNVLENFKNSYYRLEYVKSKSFD